MGIFKNRPRASWTSCEATKSRSGASSSRSADCQNPPERPGRFLRIVGILQSVRDDSCGSQECFRSLRDANCALQNADQSLRHACLRSPKSLQTDERNRSARDHPVALDRQQALSSRRRLRRRRIDPIDPPREHQLAGARIGARVLNPGLVAMVSVTPLACATWWSVPPSWGAEAGSVACHASPCSTVPPRKSAETHGDRRV